MDPLDDLGSILVMRMGECEVGAVEGMK